MSKDDEIKTLLKGYVETIRENIETENKPDYKGKDQDIEKQKEKIGHYEKEILKQIKDLDKFVDAAVDCATGDISFEELTELYQRLSK
jgi:hypothetical protein